MRHILEAGAVCGNSARTDLCGGAGGDLRPYRNRPYSTVTLLAKFRGLSTSVPRAQAVW